VAAGREPLSDRNLQAATPSSATLAPLTRLVSGVIQVTPRLSPLRGSFAASVSQELPLLAGVGIVTREPSLTQMPQTGAAAGACTKPKRKGCLVRSSLFRNTNRVRSYLLMSATLGRILSSWSSCSRVKLPPMDISRNESGAPETLLVVTSSVTRSPCMRVE
jgi:hypothetical protein